MVDSLKLAGFAVISDLALGAPQSAGTEVLIIGAGVAGLLLADDLRKRGKRVIVLESGGQEQTQDVHPLNRVTQTGDEYRGALHGRFRCLGGTSTRWGGALLPFLHQDFAERDYLGVSEWPVSYEEVTQYLPALESLFAIDPGTYDREFLRGKGSGDVVPDNDMALITRFAKWPTFRRRNLRSLFKQRIDSDPDLQIWVNATVTDFELDNDSGRLLGVRARHHGGNSLGIVAKHTVICAGAIESTRLLLLLDAQYGQRVFSGCLALGRYFHDHVSTVAAEIKTSDPRWLNRLAGFRFAGATMRSLRFELAPAMQRQLKVGSAFGHISFRSAQGSGFDALRSLMRSIQQRSSIPAGLLARVVRDVPYFASLAYWRAVHKQLYWPTPADYDLHVVVEQVPNYGNSISLSRETDVFGNPLAEINWRVSATEHATFAAYAQCFQDFWLRNGMSTKGELLWREGQSLSGGSDIFHPGGSTRMGHNPREAVLTADLRTFAVPNLWVASTSAFPSGASANPTLMLMLFSMRLAQRLAAA